MKKSFVAIGAGLVTAATLVGLAFAAFGVPNGEADVAKEEAVLAPMDTLPATAQDVPAEPDTGPVLKEPEWVTETDTIPGFGTAQYHYIPQKDDDVVYRSFWTTEKGKPFYYNSRHGFFVTLPEGFGRRQSGELTWGGHDNEFYNADTTVVISAFASYYDAVLLDYPHYADTLRMRERERLSQLGKHTVRQLTPDCWFSQGRINHSNPDNPPAGRFMRKWLLKKDIEGRECDMVLMIYFDDTSREYRSGVLKEIIDHFPDAPKSLSKAK